MLRPELTKVVFGTAILGHWRVLQMVVDTQHPTSQVAIHIMTPSTSMLLVVLKFIQMT